MTHGPSHLKRSRRFVWDHAFHTNTALVICKNKLIRGIMMKEEIRRSNSIVWSRFISALHIICRYTFQIWKSTMRRVNGLSRCYHLSPASSLSPIKQKGFALLGVGRNYNIFSVEVCEVSWKAPGKVQSPISTSQCLDNICRSAEKQKSLWV